jgi:hypothetical protein
MSAVAVAAVAATAFNLVCSGTTTESSAGKPDKETPFHHVYRIDLHKLAWCIDECQGGIAPIMSVTQQEIRMLGGTDYIVVFNRETRGIVRDLGYPGDEAIDSGKCKEAPFTQFPQEKP